MIEICHENPNSEQSKQLLKAQADSLMKLTGNSAVECFNESEFLAENAVFLLVKRNGVALACGGFRYLQPGICEMKRIYSHQAGLGKVILQALEQYAVTLGYQQINLATRNSNTQAIQFYAKHGYRAISPFGVYCHHPHYLSLAKSLANAERTLGIKKAQLSRCA
ncbi:hypothetical protein AAOGI_19650 [Agarivorans albus]